MIVNGVQHHRTSPCRLDEMLAELAITPRGIAVAINGEIVRRSRWSDTWIQPADQVEIVTAAAGG